MGIEFELREKAKERTRRLMGRNRPATPAAAIRAMRAAIRKAEEEKPAGERLKLLSTQPIDNMMHPELWEEGVNRILRLNQVDLDAVVSSNRVARIVETRRKVAEYLREERGWSFSRIGNFLGKRDHSTIVALLNPEKRRKIYEQERIRAKRAHDAFAGMDEPADNQRAVLGPDGVYRLEGNTGDRAEEA